MTSDDERWEAPAVVLDLGLGGTRVTLEAPASLGTLVRVTVISPTLWDPLVLQGEIVWLLSSESRPEVLVGVRFRPSAGSTLRALADLVAGYEFD